MMQTMSPVRPSLFKIRSLTAFTVGAFALACSGAQSDGGDGDGDPAPPDGMLGGNATGGSDSGSGSGGTTAGSGGSLGGTGGTPGGTGSMTASGGAPIDLGPSHVVIVAHQDDDLLFVNPELKRTMDRGDALTTAYVTSGNAGMGMTYVLEREMGIKSAYSFMAGAPNSWTCGLETYAGKSLNTCTLDGSKDVKLIFLRLVDGWGDGSDPSSLMKLWTGSIATSAAVDGSGLTFTRAELVASLADILTQRGATHVHTTDFSFQNRANDHSDHENAALFTVAASGAYTGAHGLSSYLTYGTTSAAPNLSEADTAVVADTFGFYASCDSELDGCSGGPTCDQSTCATSSSLYTSWFSRHYSFSRRSAPLTATVKSAEGSCLAASGNQAVMAACTGATTWTWGADYTLRTPEGLCLTAPALAASTNLSLTSCGGGDHQRWFVMDNGDIVLAATPAVGDVGGYALAQCLDATFGQGAVAQVDDCGDLSSQSWSL